MREQLAAEQKRKRPPAVRGGGHGDQRVERSVGGVAQGTFSTHKGQVVIADGLDALGQCQCLAMSLTGLHGLGESLSKANLIVADGLGTVSVRRLVAGHFTHLLDAVRWTHGSGADSPMPGPLPHIVVKNLGDTTSRKLWSFTDSQRARHISVKVRPGRAGKALEAALLDSLKSDYTKKLRAQEIARRAR